MWRKFCDSSVQIGDKVKLDIDIIEENGMNETEEQAERFQYILDHPDEVYEVSDILTPGCIGQIRLNHPVLGPTSFMDDEVILVERRQEIE